MSYTPLIVTMISAVEVVQIFSLLTLQVKVVLAADNTVHGVPSAKVTLMDDVSQPKFVPANTNVSPPKGLTFAFGVTELTTIGTLIGASISEGKKPSVVKTMTVQLPETAVSLS